MTDAELDELERLAEKARPVFAKEIGASDTIAGANDFDAAATPSVILELIAEVRRLTAYVEDVLSKAEKFGVGRFWEGEPDLLHWEGELKDALDERDRLRAERTALIDAVLERAAQYAWYTLRLVIHEHTDDVRPADIVRDDIKGLRHDPDFLESLNDDLRRKDNVR